MSAFEKALRATLLLAVEDDTGLWQIPLEMQVAVPGASIAEAVELARDVVHYLLDEKWVIGVKSEVLGAGYNDIDQRLFRTRLADSIVWTEPRTSDECFAIRVTDLGEEYYWEKLDGR